MTTEQNTEIWQLALDLYQRGLNVFPIPTRAEIEAWNATCPDKKRDPLKKSPYLLEILFDRRMHVCGPECHDEYGKLVHPSLRKLCTFESLFGAEGHFPTPNLAVLCNGSSGNLFSLDCDDPDSFSWLMGQLQSRGIPHWAYTSGRGGHCLMRAIEGEVGYKVIEIDAGASEIDGCVISVDKIKVEVISGNRYVVLPPSIHPYQGKKYQWLTTNPFELPSHEGPPAVSVDALNWLGLELHSRSDNKEQQAFLEQLPAWGKNICHSVLEFLYQGTFEGERNVRLFQAACELSGCGVEFVEARSYLLDACKRCKPEYPEDEANRTINSAFSEDREASRVFMNRVGVRVVIQRAKMFMNEFDWRGACGRYAQTDRKVFLAAIQRVEQDRSRRFRFSIREVVLMTGMSKDTVSSAIKRLCGQPYNQSGKTHESPLKAMPILREVVNGGSKATTQQSPTWKARKFEFTEVVLKANSVTTIDLDEQVSTDVRLPRSRAERDIFFPRRTSDFYVWTCLCAASSLSVREIAQETELCQDTVRTVLKRLFAYNLIAMSEQRGRYVGIHLTDVQVAAKADELGCSGKTAARERFFQVEREININRLLASKRMLWLNSYRAYWED